MKSKILFSLIIFILVGHECKELFRRSYLENLFSLEEFLDSEPVFNFIASSNLVRDSLNSNIKNENVISNTLSTTTTTESTTTTTSESTTESNSYNFTNNHAFPSTWNSYSVRGENRNVKYENRRKNNGLMHRVNKVDSLNLVRKGSNSNITNKNSFDNEASRLNKKFDNYILSKNFIWNSLNSSVDNSNGINNDLG
ncbi:hypothetical protein BpHYR1_042090 [Brachionus plicatilis]|uniref:Uncharacterized protein n=1 Tax=Brachionus plicatilis TaxID=10195 RepID=A0A3M7R8X0_BRAPC|nr:hypothetical protein BpHYR1_042090 [Brachionus plicatilis]